MQAGTHTPQGVTWIRPVAAVLTVLGLLATVFVSMPNGAQANPGVVTTSSNMIEMLNGVARGHAMTLPELRDDLLGDAPGSGSGIDVAVIDTGVAPVDGLTGAHKVVYGPDLSMEGQSPDFAYLDTYGHGTHMAGIIAGDRAGHEGIAPGARIVSVKVAGADGLTTVPQVVAAIDWVIEHRNTDGLNIRVLNLSLGQAGIWDHVGDPLSAAVERAWESGIFVVVAAGNRGERQKHLDSPAISPAALAVGATQIKDADTRSNRTVPGWSARGDRWRRPDVVAPGRSIASYRVPGSTIDQAAKGARYGDDLFLGSGSSQSAAAVSGLAAVLLENNPRMNPEQVRKAIRSGSYRLDYVSRNKQGRGHVDGEYTVERGSVRVRDRYYVSATAAGIGFPTGPTWSGGTWSSDMWKGSTWSGMTWSGGTWSGSTWSGVSWSGSTWSGSTWSGGTWSGSTWSGSTWSGGTWSGGTWSGGTWSGGTWSGMTWSGEGWG